MKLFAVFGPTSIHATPKGQWDLAICHDLRIALAMDFASKLSAGIHTADTSQPYPKISYV